MKKWSFNELAVSGHIIGGGGVRYLTHSRTTVVTCEDSLGIPCQVHHIVHDIASEWCTVQMLGNQYTKVLTTTEFFTLSTIIEPD